MSKIVKTVTRTYTVEGVLLNQFTFDEEFRRIRLKYHRDKSMVCFNCGLPFLESDRVSSLVMKTGNRLACTSCAILLKPKGVNHE